MLRHALIALFLLTAATVASAQNQPVYQSGLNVTRGHAAVWLGNGAIGDAGGAGGSAKPGQGYLTELGITNTGTPFCVNDALTTAPGGYHSFCMGANALGAGVLTYSAYGGAAALPLEIIVNGVVQPFPGSITGLTTVNSNTALKLLASTVGTVLRQGYAAPGDSNPLVYTASNSACSLNGGLGDGGSQVPTSDGKCWLAELTYPLDSRDWGAATPIIYVSKTSGSNQANKNYCLDQNNPCGTLVYGVSRYIQFPWMGFNTLSILDASTYNETINWYAGYAAATSSANATVIPQLSLTGPASGPVPTIAGDTLLCGAIIGNGGAFGIQNVRVSANYSCGSPLFLQFGAVGNVYGNVTIGAAGAEQLHVEDSSQLQIWSSLTVTGGGLNFAGVLEGTKLVFNSAAATMTFSGTPSYINTGIFKADQGGVIFIGTGWSFTGAVSNFGSYYLTRNATLDNVSGHSLPGSAGTLEQGGQVFPAILPSVSYSDGSLGTGGSIAISANSGDYAGAVVMTTGSPATASSGVFTIAYQGIITNRQCVFQLQPGSSAWATGSNQSTATIVGSNYSIAWQNGGPGNLAFNKTYQVGYTCNGGNGQ